MSTYEWLPEGFDVRTADTNGVRLSAAVGGRGPLLVLLHGWPQTGRAWARVMPALAEDHTVVVPDLRGTGASERPMAATPRSTRPTTCAACSPHSA